MDPTRRVIDLFVRTRTDAIRSLFRSLRELVSQLVVGIPSHDNQLGSLSAELLADCEDDLYRFSRAVLERCAVSFRFDSRKVNGTTPRAHCCTTACHAA